MEASAQALEGSTSEQKKTGSVQNGLVKSIRSGATFSNTDIQKQSTTPMFESSLSHHTSISSASVSRVKISRKPTRTVKALKVTSPVFSMKVGGSFAYVDQDSLCLKTVQCSFIKDLQQFSDCLPKKGMMQNGKLYHAKGSDFPTYVNDFSSLLTPTKSDAKRIIEFKLESLIKSYLRKAQGNSFFNPNLTEVLAGKIGLKPSAAFLIWMMGYPKTFFTDYWQQVGIQSARESLRGYSVESKKRSVKNIARRAKKAGHG
jgi:hypothetical protein